MQMGLAGFDNGISRISVNRVLLAIGFIYFVALFNHGLVPSMEPRFAEVIKEMIASGNWLIPVKNGRPYIEYPPLYYWLGLFGKQLGLPMVAAIRLPSYLALMGWIYLMVRWQRMIAPQLPSYAFALVGAAMPLVLFQFAIAQSDSLLVFGTLLSFTGYTAYRMAPVPPAFPWSLWLGVALATAAKGPVGIACTLPVFVLDTALGNFLYPSTSGQSAVAVFIRRCTHELLKLGWARGLSLVALVTVPWYIAAGFTAGWGFVETTLIYQNFDRFTTGYSHAQAWWYYFMTVSYDFFPVSLLLPVGLYFGLSRLREFPVRLVVLWALYTFVFFSISGSKQGKYILPVAPAFVALAFIALGGLSESWRRRGWSFVRGFAVFLIAAWAVVMVGVVPFYSSKIGGVDGFIPIKAQLEREPARLISYQYPRSLTLYELGAPMEFVRSARDLYQRIHDGELLPGEYILVKRSHLGEAPGPDQSWQLSPFPNPAYFETVLEVDIEKPSVLLRVVEGAAGQPLPQTPEPREFSWRQEMFDTD
jgi:4-amino-4-deoxy-L-arabinose transferase-like glycosyltransferase